MTEQHERSKYDQHPHVTPISTYTMVLIALVVLMALTVGAAQIALPGGTVVNNIVAMTIAVVKASLVVWFFMGVRHNTKLTKFYAALGFFWFFFLFIIFADYSTRKYEVTPTWNASDPGSAMGREMREPLSSPNQTNIRER
jgi:cytochrome c oxidase subunit IV